VTEKYTAPIHLGEWSIAFISVEIIIYNCAFSKDPQSIFHTVPLFVVEMTGASHALPFFSKLVCPTLYFDMGFL